MLVGNVRFLHDHDAGPDWRVLFVHGWKLLWGHYGDVLHGLRRHLARGSIVRRRLPDVDQHDFNDTGPVWEPRKLLLLRR